MRSWRKSEVGSLARSYAWLVVKLRWVIVVGWAAATVAAALTLPDTRPNSDLTGFAPPNSRAIATETASAKAFGYPMLSRTVIVQRNEAGLSQAAQERMVQRAVGVAKGTLGDVGPIAAVVPIANARGVFPASTEPDTTALNYVMTKPGTSFGEELAAAEAFGQKHINQPDDHLVGVTGTIPAQLTQTDILYDRLPLLEIATLVVVIVIVALKFRSVIAPLVALVTAGASYFLAVRVTNYIGEYIQGGVPEELKPLVLALVLGIVTDYAIFYLSSMRTALGGGMDRLTAAQTAAAQTNRIVLVAGIAVAAGSAAMLVAESPFFRAFGPVLSISVLTAMVVSLTLLPALLAIFGRGLFWPSRRPRTRPRRLARVTARVVTVKAVALLLGAASIAGLAYLSAGMGQLRLGVSFVEALPDDTEAQRAADAAAQGFAAGIISPTEVLLQGGNFTTEQDKLTQLARELEQQPGVAGVVGPGGLPQEAVSGALVSESGQAARLVVILDHDPLGAVAIRDLDQLSAALPGLLQKVGLDGVTAGVAGDTAVASELVAATTGDLRRIAIAVLVVNLVLLMVFLRAIAAPVLLLACSVLALTASLGALTMVFQGWLGHDGITFYVPFAASVLLLSLGSDYNIYGVGHIWTRAKHTTLRQAIKERMPETSGAITAAGITLAATFGMLALVPLRQFRELAFVMALGVLIDAILVRSILVPAVLALLGRHSAWPRKLEGAQPAPSPARAPAPVQNA